MKQVLPFYRREVLSMDRPIEARFENHEDRIKNLEVNYTKLVDEISYVKTGQIRLENTVLTVSQSQNGLLNTLITNTFDLKKTKTISRKEIIIASISGGGILGVIVGAILKFL
jgi:hypothetical protein